MNNERDADLRFDRLVDGELSAAEYKALLAALDDEPGGWQKCAVAFLEAQALTSDLGHVRGALDLSDSGPHDSAAPPAKLSLMRRLEWHTLFAVALSFLVAFTLGALAPRIFQGGVQEPPLAGNNHSSPAVATVGPIPAAGNSRHQAFRPVGNVRLVMDGPGGGAAETGDVPVYDVGTDLEGYFGQDRPSLPPELIELLQQRGHEVQRQQQYVPAQLEDGRQVIVPVERYLITPVSARGY